MAATDPYDRIHELDDLGELDPSWAGTRVEWLEVAGTRVRLLRRDGNPDGPLVVCVHGLGGTATNWVEVMQGLAAVGDVVAVDLPGFGETAPPRATSPRPAANARFLATLLHALDRGPVVLVGNSMGGLISTLLAGEDPELVAQLVLVCPALPPTLLGAVPSKAMVATFAPFLVPVIGPRIVRRRLRRMTFEEQYRATMEAICARPQDIEERSLRIGVANLERVRELRWRGRAFGEATAGTTELLTSPGGRRRVIRAIRGVTAPTLYLRGSEDPLVPSGTTSMVRRLRPDWTIEEPDGLGHVPMLEDPAWTVDRILGFVRQASGSDVRTA